MTTMNWDDPAHRLTLLECVGVNEYNRLMSAHRDSQLVGLVNGYSLRRVGSRWGPLVMVDGAGMAFPTEAQARSYAATLRPA
jgi:hypothetical protein